MTGEGDQTPVSVASGLQVEAIYFLAREVSLVILPKLALQRDPRTIEKPNPA